MKKLSCIFLVLLLYSCSTTRITESWRSKEFLKYQPKKILVIGITQNLTAKKIFEEKLSTKLNNRGILAIESSQVFEPAFTSSKQTEANIFQEVENLIEKGFDAILISAVKGVDEKTSYSGYDFRTDYYLRRFGHYYFLYQDVYFDRGYYENYKVYHIESSLYNLKDAHKTPLVWVASYDIVDPKKINATINNYVKIVLNSLEKERIVPLN